ncbi:DNase I-like protein [Anaeromyces robustus]|uniref:DNase I-like protein n=1 Tax=Anaeromyces robustus TaxID=1754192 RepID=A0A1Y1XD23_9FUNG|nr:DNase I-like protein [Anaeromyces robustus]|eukprot:ORX83582.1 DNase I-like protein [Anaeromyces robustus]
MGKGKVIGISLSVLLMIALYFSFNRNEYEGIIGEDIYKDSVKIISFNLRYGRANDGPNSWEYRRKSVFEYFKAAQPCIMGTQEGQLFQLEDIKRNVPNLEYVGKPRSLNDENSEYSAIFYDKSVFRLYNSDTFWLSDTPEIPGTPSWDSYHPRICTFGVFEKLNNKELLNRYIIYNCHLEYRSRYSRKKSMEVINQHIDDNFPTYEIILLGDFNVEEENEDVMKYMNSTGWKDCYKTINPASNMGTFHNFTGDLDRFGNKTRLDYVLIKHERALIPSESYIDTTKYGDHLISDHYPLVCKFKLQLFEGDKDDKDDDDDNNDDL